MGEFRHFPNVDLYDIQPPKTIPSLASRYDPVCGSPPVAVDSPCVRAGGSSRPTRMFHNKITPERHVLFTLVQHGMNPAAFVP